MQREISPWIYKAVFYHIYPLGLCGAPLANDFMSEPINRMEQLQNWIPHIKNLGCDALYFGPVFESDFHGYDTADYLLVDRRLGTNDTLKQFSNSLHQNGIKLVLDTVFNHVGRHFWAFTDLQRNGEASPYKDWFLGVDFSRQSTYGDNFYYEGWYDAYNLVRLNLRHPEVKEYLFKVVSFWIEEFHIDGLRLDVAEIMDKDFLAELAAFCRHKKQDVWLLGEVITGDYTHWANDHILDSTTNYEAYKGLYSSHNDYNLFEIAHTLNRQFGQHGIYKDLLLYNFADNHDTTRIINILNNGAHVYTVYAIVFTMPGVPSIYYGSEWGIEGIKGAHEDTMLRPAVCTIPAIDASPLSAYVQQLVGIKQKYVALQQGDYKELYVSNTQFVFSRSTDDNLVIVAINIAAEPVSVEINIDLQDGMIFQDELAPSYQISINNKSLNIYDIQAYSAKILVSQATLS